MLPPEIVLEVLSSILSDANKVYADMTIMFTERFRSDNYKLREFLGIQVHSWLARHAML